MVRLFKIISCLTLFSSVLGGKNGTSECSATASTKCDAGHFLASGNCTACTQVAASVCGGGQVPTSKALTCPGGSSVTAQPTTKTTATCVSCVSNTQKAAKTDGSYPIGKLASGSVGCTDCEAGAFKCSDATTATGCNPGFYLDSKDCKACTPVAASVCGDGGVPTTAVLSCPSDTKAKPTTKTTATCVTCVSQTQQAAKADGSYPVGKLASGSVGCTDCEAGAFACSDATTATKCNPGFYLSSNDCKACTPVAASVCGTGKVPTTVVKTCPTDTKAQPTTSTGATCESCTADGVYTKAGTDGCINCTAGAKTCDVNGALTCMTGWYLKTADKTCVLCDAQECSQVTDANFCGTGKAVVNTTKLCANPLCNKAAAATNVVSDNDTCCKAASNSGSAGGGGGSSGVAGVASISLLAVISTVFAL